MSVARIEWLLFIVTSFLVGYRAWIVYVNKIYGAYGYTLMQIVFLINSFVFFLNPGAQVWLGFVSISLYYILAGGYRGKFDPRYEAKEIYILKVWYLWPATILITLTLFIYALGIGWYEIVLVIADLFWFISLNILPTEWVFAKTAFFRATVIEQDATASEKRFVNPIKTRIIMSGTLVLWFLWPLCLLWVSWSRFGG